MRRAALALICLAGVAMPAPALAQSQVAPPGNSGVDEYLETVPSAGGSRPVARPGEPRNGVLSQRARRRLESLGADGRAAAALAGATAPAGASAQAGRRGAGAGGDVPALPPSAVSGSADAEGGLLEAVGRAVTSEDSGLGGAFPILLVLSLLAAAVLSVLRFRRPA